MNDQSSVVPEAVEKTQNEEPKGTRVMQWVRWLLIVLSVAMAFVGWAVFLGGGSAGGSALYQCPMHPQIVSDRPGECPICFMALEPVSEQRMKPAAAATPHPAAPPVLATAASSSGAAMAAAPVSSSGAAPAASSGYGCPMDPEVHSDVPGRCPKCKMALVPVSELPPPMPAGMASVELSQEQVRAAGVRVVTAEEAETRATLRVSASVQAQEQTVVEVHVRAAGFVEAVHVGETGVQVGSGQPLITLYSPEIYQAESELLAARSWLAPPPSPRADAARDGQASSDAPTDPAAQAPLPASVGLAGPALAARRRLELLGVSADTIERVLAKGEPERSVTIGAPRGGYITRKSVVLGSYVTPEMALYEIVDLSRVWVVADLYQQDAALARRGTEGVFRVAEGEGEPVKAVVDLVYPRVDPEARTTRVRMTIDNRKQRLLPGAWGWVEFERGRERGVVIPADALVDTGERRYVFVETAPGSYAPRLVEAEATPDEQLRILRGLEPGERVVSGGAFLLDSESRLRASVAAATAPSPPPAVDTKAQPAGSP